MNTATVEELQRLPGVGPVTAQNIVAARAEKPFKSVADLDRVKGIGPKTLDKLRPFVVVKNSIASWTVSGTWTTYRA